MLKAGSALPKAAPRKWQVPEPKFQALGYLDRTTLRRSFDDLPGDGYLPGRYRRYSNFKLVNGLLQPLGRKPFVQSKDVNRLVGGILRDFPPLDQSIVANSEFQALVRAFTLSCSPADTPATEVGVHQIRVEAQPGSPGRPAPEGAHQDGFDFVGIFCVGREGITGGETHLFVSENARDPCFTYTVNAGEMLSFNDRSLFHYTTEIVADQSGWGRRDVFIFTARYLDFPHIATRPH